MLNWGEIVPNSPCLAVCNEKMVEQTYLCFLGSPSRTWLVINSCFLLKYFFLLASLSSLMSLQTLLPLNFHKVGDFTGWPQLALLASRAAWVWVGTRLGATKCHLSYGIVDVPQCPGVVSPWLELADVHLTRRESRASLHLPAKHSLGISTAIHTIAFLYVFIDSGPEIES